MSIHNIDNIGQKVKKIVRDATIGVALISTLQACENVSGAGGQKYNNHDSLENTIRYIDNDIDTFESTLPYIEQRNQPIPSISAADYNWIQSVLMNNTMRSEKQNEKPTMDSIAYIALHSTEHLPGQLEENVIKFLQNSGKIHFIVKRDGTLVQFLPSLRNEVTQIDHLGKEINEKSHAMRNHDPNMTLKTIGIEVSAHPAQARSEAQYTTIKKLLGYLGELYKLKQKDIVTHTMVAYSNEFGMMRKQDPAYINWEKLGVAPASAQINRDVVAGTIAPNLVYMYEWCRKPKTGNKPGLALSHNNAVQYLRDHYSGLDNAIMLHKQRNGGTINPLAQRVSDPKAWMSIDEISITQKNYTYPVPVYKKKRGSRRF